MRKYCSDCVVCVCNATYCDTTEAKIPEIGQVLVYTSSKDGQRLSEKVMDISSLNVLNRYTVDVVNITVQTNITYQIVIGFGGAVTDAASMNMMALSAQTRKNLIDSYFAKNGIEYNMARVPIASCDYSTRPYTYLDYPNDFNLSNFSLAMEDFKYKIPILKQIMEASSKQLLFYASPWTAPAWMKSSDSETGYGKLTGVAGDKYHKTWAEYLVRFLDEYKKEGIEFWGMTMQNEPSNGYIIPGKWQCMGWDPESQRDFVKTDLGPAITRSEHVGIKLMIHDDQRLFLPKWPSIILSDKEAAQYVSGIGVHWYWDWLIGPEVLSATHESFPDKFILATEACDKTPPPKEIGSWEEGEKYSESILDNLNHWSAGWVDWNMCLNLQGGPNWVKNFDNSPIIVNTTADEFYKQPMFYHLGHFSKFVPNGSVRIHSGSTDNDLKFVSALRTDNTVVLVVLNKGDSDKSISVKSGAVEIQGNIPSRSIQTYLWQNK